MKLAKINLPAPSSKLIEAFNRWQTSIELSMDAKQWLDQFYDQTVNCVAHWFGPVPELDLLVREQYQQYFNVAIIAGAGIMQNVGNHCACLPPHSDRGRKLAINWYFDLGGDNVETVFYDEISPTASVATNYHYNQVHELQRYHLTNTNWYAYEVDRAHAVKNIQTRRTFLSIAVVDNLDTFDLDKLVNNISVETLTI